MSTAMGDADAGTVTVECEECGYTWEYTGQMWRATCPRCSHKTPTGLKPDEFDDDGADGS